MKLIKFIPLISLVPVLLLTGCNHPFRSTTPQPETVSANKFDVSQGTVALNTMVLNVTKKTNIAWKDVLPEWGAQKMVVITRGDAQAIYKQISGKSHVSTEFMQIATTTNYTPVPFSSHSSSETPNGGSLVDNGIDMTLLPGYRNVNGPISLMVSLNNQDVQGSFNVNQFVSLKQGQSLILSKIIDENTQKVVIISPRIVQ